MQVTISEAIAHALNDLGVDVLTHVPGVGASETFQSLKTISMKNPPISFNEETAFSIAHGASIAGKRSALLIKAHGFAKAGNAVLDSLYTEITAGFVTIIFEDKSGSHSDNIMEIEPILQGFFFPYELSKPETIYDDIIRCYSESEKRNIPYALLVDSDWVDKQVDFNPKTNLKKTFTYQRDVLQHVVSPLLSDYQHKVFSSKKFYGDSTALERPDLPNIPDDLPLGSKIAAKKYIPFFDVFKEYRGDIVTGDTSVSSSFSFPPYDSIDIVTHIGGSIPLAIGVYSAGVKNVWALTGDFGFIAAGHMALIEALEREVPLKIVIFYNKQAAATGGQQIHKQIMMRLLAGYDNFIVHLANPEDPFEISKALDETRDADELKILLVDY